MKKLKFAAVVLFAMMGSANAFAVEAGGCDEGFWTSKNGICGGSEAGSSVCDCTYQGAYFSCTYDTGLFPMTWTMDCTSGTCYCNRGFY